MRVEKTGRGFEIIRFKDAYDSECTLQASSAIDDRESAFYFPGTSFVWLGIGDNRMHLNRKQVRELAERLDNWLRTGSFKRRSHVSNSV